MQRPDINEKILKELYWKKTLSKAEIASILKCNITTIHKKMNKFNILVRNHREAVKIAMQKNIIIIKESRLKQDYLNKKLSMNAIAKKLKCDKSIISREIKRHKIPIRNASEANKLVPRKKIFPRSLIKKLYYEQRLNQRQLAKKINVHKETARKIMKEYGLKTRDASERMTIYKKSNFSGKPKEKAYLTGFRLGDLRVVLSKSKNLILVDCTSTKKDQLNLFKNLFEKYGHIWISKPRQDGNKVFLVRLNKSFLFLLSKKDMVPKWIRRNDDYFSSFLAGYTDAEGSFWISKEKSANFKIASYDKNILQQIYKWLLHMKVNCNPPRIHVKAGHQKRNGQIYRKNEWSLNVQKKIELLKLIQILKAKIRHRKRFNDLIKAEHNILARN